MIGPVPLLFAAAAAPDVPVPMAASAPVGASVQAAQLFERDWVLMQWALKRFDADRNKLLSDGEARAAALDFRRIADGNGDGRITQTEFRAAREFILARY